MQTSLIGPEKKASAFILLVPPHRRNTILSASESWKYDEPRVAEPVRRFEHSMNVPLVVLASFQDGMITHVADGRKGASAGTELVRLNMANLKQLSKPLPFEDVANALPRKFQHHLRKTCACGGKLPPKTLGAVVDALLGLDQELHSRLGRFSARRVEFIDRLTRKQAQNLAFQKESVGAALDIAGISKEEVLDWAPSIPPSRSFLDDLPRVYAREDAMLLADFSTMPGFNAVAGATHFAAKTFVDPRRSGKRLKIIMANRLPLEEQTGADLIYYNEAYRSFVMVQYKAMEKGNDGAEFRWKDGDNLSLEVGRMNAMLTELVKVKQDAHPDGFRFSSNPFFLKFCPRVVFDPDDKGLFKGVYLPLGLWGSLTESGQMKGPKGGNLLTFRNVGRYLTNSEFVPLVAKSWVGTTINQSAALEHVIRSVLETGKTVTYAVQCKVEYPDEGSCIEPDESVDPPFLDDEEVDFE